MYSPTERQKRILEQIQQQSSVSIEALAQRLGGANDEIQADIDKLCEHGLLQRQAGETGPLSSVENMSYTTRQALYAEEKAHIGREVARHIPDHSSLFINIGTTTEAVAKALMNHKGLRIVTNDLNVASLLSPNPELEVIVAGGIVRSRDQGIVGEATIDLIRQFRLDYGIIGISAIDAGGALLDFDYREVRVAQAIIENSRQVFLITDHSKFNRNAMVRLGHISQLSALFTDAEPPAAIAQQLAAANVALHIAKAES